MLPTQRTSCTWSCHLGAKRSPKLRACGCPGPFSGAANSAQPRPRSHLGAESQQQRRESAANTARKRSQTGAETQPQRRESAANPAQKRSHANVNEQFSSPAFAKEVLFQSRDSFHSTKIHSRPSVRAQDRPSLAGLIISCPSILGQTSPSGIYLCITAVLVLLLLLLLLL